MTIRLAATGNVDSVSPCRFRCAAHVRAWACVVWFYCRHGARALIGRLNGYSAQGQILFSLCKSVDIPRKHNL